MGRNKMKTKSYVTLPGQEPVWNMASGRTAALKLVNDQTGQMVMAFEEITPVGTETPLHLHRESDEVMYILSGEYSFKIGDEFITGGPGTCAFMPRGIPHAWKYSGTETGRAFFIYTPGAAGKVFEESVKLQRPAPAGTTVDPQVAQLFQRYGWEIVGPPPF
jgi:mannose-6-phosphate isomerase-like protein (cupin superfamily)